MPLHLQLLIVSAVMSRWEATDTVIPEASMIARSSTCMFSQDVIITALCLNCSLFSTLPVNSCVNISKLKLY